MAGPFGKLPRFVEYLRWAAEQGCTWQSGYAQSNDGFQEITTRIIAPDGRWYLDIGTNQFDLLVPSTIARMDRRLGIKSPFPSLDNTDEEDIV